MARKPIALAVQGGAGPISLESYKRNRPAVGEILARVAAMLMDGASAMQVVEEAVRLFEKHPSFNAGTGSSLRYDGSVQLDASIMDGATMMGAGVGAVTGVLYPVTLARYVLERTPHVLMVGEWATRFARECGMELVADEELIVEERRRLWERKLAARETPDDQVLSSGGTVGAVALDAEGKLAAATSTGGMVLSLPGRVGDSAILGAGTYADAHSAASCTGVGESIMRVLMAKVCADAVINGMSPQEAAELAVRIQGEKTPGTSGAIVVDISGALGLAYNSDNMYRGYFTPERGVVVPE
ncbi:isoaspartyl peptidase/L-asparaginase [bacterium]|nr:isoaspartyl peptidase/L-asparaginase [bacterium]